MIKFQPTVFILNVARILFLNIIMEIDCLLLPPACYYTSAMPVSLTAWLCVKMYTSVEHDFCTTCNERPPVLRDRFCWAERVVAQDRFYCILKYLQTSAGARDLFGRPVSQVHVVSGRVYTGAIHRLEACEGAAGIPRQREAREGTGPRVRITH